MSLGVQPMPIDRFTVAQMVISFATSSSMLIGFTLLDLRILTVAVVCQVVDVS